MHGAMRRIFQTRSAECKISKARIAFAWRAMDAFYEEDGRIRVSNMVSFEPNIVSDTLMAADSISSRVRR
jgi:hypothetical protein